MVHTKRGRKSHVPLYRKNTPHSLQEGRKTGLSVHPVIGVEPLHEITLHSQEGARGMNHQHLTHLVILNKYKYKYKRWVVNYPHLQILIQ